MGGTPTNARYLFALALRAGLSVAHDGEGWLWYGTLKQLQSSDIWASSQGWNIQRRRWTFTTEGLRAYVVKDARAPERLRVQHDEFHHLSHNSRAYRRPLERARADSGYQGFRQRLLAAPPVPDESSEM